MYILCIYICVWNLMMEESFRCIQYTKAENVRELYVDARRYELGYLAAQFYCPF